MTTITMVGYGEKPGELIRQFEPELMDAYPISTKVNSVKNNTLDIILPPAKKQGELF
jgi:hypothetical protein